jgi:hypothetical protein
MDPISPFQDKCVVILQLGSISPSIQVKKIPLWLQEQKELFFSVKVI